MPSDVKVQFQYKVQRDTRNGTVPLPAVRGGRVLQIDVPVTASNNRLVSTLDGAYLWYFCVPPYRVLTRHVGV